MDASEGVLRIASRRVGDGEAACIEIIGGFTSRPPGWYESGHSRR